MKLKKIIFMIAAAIAGCVAGDAQEAHVEKSVWGVQGSLPGFWGYNESRLADAVALRSEVGFAGGYMYTYSNSGSRHRYLFLPQLTLEPRWYYDLAQRQAKSKHTMHNSGNYFSLQTTFYLQWPVISNFHFQPVNTLTIVPSWGIRRHYGTHFCLEAGAGVGYQHVFNKNNDELDRNNLAYNLHFRVGYTF
jgi:hypothetical protein